jgi:hypothetical protein
MFVKATGFRARHAALRGGAYGGRVASSVGPSGRAMAIVLLLVGSGIARAAPPGDAIIADTNAVLFSEQVLQRALSDIAKMQESELRAFTHYLTACKQLGNQQACSEALTSYRVEFGGARPLDDLMSARNFRDTNDVYEIEHGGKALADSDWIIRESIIVVELEENARLRFRALRAGER